MRLLISAFVVLVVILSASLVLQVRQRRVAEMTLDRLISDRSKALPSERGSGDQSAIVAALLAENRALRARAESANSVVVSESAAKVAALKDILARLPEQSIPELRMATDGDWYSAVDGGLDSMDDCRVALSKLRTAAEKRFALKAQPALAAYLQAHGGEFPKDVSDLRASFDGQMDEAILSRYKVVPASEVKNVRVGGEWAITQKSLVDSAYDSRSVIGPNGWGSYSNR